MLLIDGVKYEVVIIRVTEFGATKKYRLETKK